MTSHIRSYLDSIMDRKNRGRLIHLLKNLHQRKVVVIQGCRGSGKSTLMRIITEVIDDSLTLPVLSQIVPNIDHFQRTPLLYITGDVHIIDEFLPSNKCVLVGALHQRWRIVYPKYSLFITCTDERHKVHHEEEVINLRDRKLPDLPPSDILVQELKNLLNDDKMARVIQRWWIPICYDPRRQCGQNMMAKSWEKYLQMTS